MNFFVYIMRADDGFYYTGQTNDVEQRLKQHQRGRVTATSYRSGWQVMHVEEYPTRAEAMKRERQIKARKSRRYIEQLIASPEREDSRMGDKGGKKHKAKGQKQKNEKEQQKVKRQHDKQEGNKRDQQKAKF